MEGSPPGDALPPPPQRATPARKGARCGTGAGSPRPHRPHPEHTGRGTLAARPRGRAVGGGTAPDTRRPSQQWQAIPPRGRPPITSPPRHAAPTGHAGQGDSVGPPHPHTRARSTWVADPNSPPSGRAVGGGGAPDLRRPSQQQPGRGEPGRDRPPQARQTEQGTGAGHAEGHGPRGTALPAPSAGTARGAHATPPRGGGSGRRGSASAHTRKGHTGTTRMATGPSSRNAQTAWIGVPASEGKGHPDGTARHTQRGIRGAGWGKRERHNTRYQPEPPKLAASATHTRTGHCSRQGSSGALRHAPTPRLGSLRASPRGSHWRQASSTGPAAPAPRATTH